MRRLALVGLIACLLSGLAAGTAQADYYISKKRAEHFARDYFHHKVGYHYTTASCRPQGRNAPVPGYVYHRWTCGFAVGDSRYEPACIGSIMIAGSSSSHGSYYHRIDYHEGKCYYGV
jgi:hypothetical protein